MTESFPRFELKVEGITCVKCAGRIEEALESFEPPALNVRVDILTNNVVFSIKSRELLDQYVSLLNLKGYTVKKISEVTIMTDKEKRIIKIKVGSGNVDTMIQVLSEMEGVEKPNSRNNEVTISYNPIYIRGSEIMKKIYQTYESRNEEVQLALENPFQDEDVEDESEYSLLQVMTCMVCMILLVVSSLMPMDLSDTDQTWTKRVIYVLFTVILTGIIMWSVGISIFKTCIRQLTRGLNVNMITLISVGSGLAFIFGCVYMIIGIARTVNGCHDNLYYYIDNAAQHLQTSAAIFTSVVTGKYIQGRIKKRIVRRIRGLKAKMRVNSGVVSRIIPRNKSYDIHSTETLHPALIERGDLIQLRTGLLPFDGFIERGSVQVMENAQFGSEKIEIRSKGHRVMSGSQIVSVEEEPLLRVSEPLEQTTAGRLFFEIKQSTSGGEKGDKTSEVIARFTKNFIFLIFVIGFLTLSFWLCAYIFSFACAQGITISYPFERAIAVLVASCPCALGTAIPMIYAIVLRRALNHGVLVKDSSSIDMLNVIDTVVFDKTGTITGSYQIVGTQVVDCEMSEATLWELISVIEEDHLQHPVGLALYQEALKRVSDLGKPKEAIAKDKENAFENYIGAEGIITENIEIEGVHKKIGIGNRNILKRFGIDLNEEEEAQKMMRSDKDSCCSLKWDKKAEICCSSKRNDINICCISDKMENKGCCSSEKIEKGESCCPSKNSETLTCCGEVKSSEKNSCCSTNAEEKQTCCSSEIKSSELFGNPCSSSNDAVKESCCSDAEIKGDECCSQMKQIEPTCCKSQAKTCCSIEKEEFVEENQNPDITILTEVSPMNYYEINFDRKSEHLDYLYLIIDDRIAMKIIVNVHESLKENSKELISGLKKERIEVHLLTGDNYENAVQTADIIGIKRSNVKAGVTPQEKVQYLDELMRKRQRKVLMVGDGINDITAFKQADLSCTINFKSSQNLSHSNFVIIDNNVESILGLFILAKSSSVARKIVIFTSIMYNIPIILSASGCTMIFFHFELPAFMAAWAMFLSSTILTLLANLVELVQLKRKSPVKGIKDVGAPINQGGYARF